MIGFEKTQTYVGSVVILFVCIAILHCKEKASQRFGLTHDFIFDSIHNKKIPIYNAKQLRQLIKSHQDSTDVFAFFTSFQKQSIVQNVWLDSIIQENKCKCQLVHVSLDFYTSAQEKIIGLPFSKQSKTILLYEPSQAFWYKEINENWNGLAPAFLIVKKDTSLFYNSYNQVNAKELNQNLLALD